MLNIYYVTVYFSREKVNCGVFKHLVHTKISETLDGDLSASIGDCFAELERANVDTCGEEYA